MINWNKAKQKCRMKEIFKVENFYYAINDETQVWHLHNSLNALKFTVTMIGNYI